MRPYSSGTERLPDSEIKCFLARHIPYRLEFLRQGSAWAFNSVKDPVIVETTLMAGRQLIQFLGLDIKFSDDGRPFLSDEECEEYHCYQERRRRIHG
jgi:hypothetical protein